MTSRLRIVIAVITALALLTTGTFTWYQVAEIKNEFSGQKEEGVITFRDDFDGTARKDIFVENKGSVTVYVRIKLNETMNLASYTWRPTQASDWITHTYNTSAADCGHQNQMAQGLFHTYFHWTMGGQKYYMPSPPGATQHNDPTVYNGTETGVKQTPSSQVIPAAQWQAMTNAQKEAFSGWIYAPDGYDYWSQPLAPDSATGLLLHGVSRELDLLKNYDYYYAINVIYEIADISDVPMMRNGAAPVNGSAQRYPEADAEGKEILDWLTGQGGTTQPPAVTGIQINGGNRSIAVGDDISLTYTITPAGSDAGKTIHWSSDNAAVALLNVSADGKTATVHGVAPGTANITVWVEDNGNTYQHSITVTVSSGTPSASVTITGGNKTVQVGQTVPLQYVVTPSGYDLGKTVNWSANNATYFTLGSVSSTDGSSSITGLAVGSATVTLTIGSGAAAVTDTITVTVVAADPGPDIPIKPGDSFTPIYNGDPETSDAYYGVFNFLDSSQNELFHNGAIHLEDVISDGNYANVSVTAPAPYTSSITIGTDQHSKPSIIFSYAPTNTVWKNYYDSHGGDANLVIPVQVTLTRGSQSATITINMTYMDCLVTFGS